METSGCPAAYVSEINRIFAWLKNRLNIIIMKRIYIVALIAAAVICGTSCTSHYMPVSVERSRILIDSRYDNAYGDNGTRQFIAPYKQVVDSIISPVVGKSARYMAADRPESLLSNLLADILIYGSADYGEKPDFSVYNIGGMRSAFAEGDVTYGDVVDVAPFDNKIYFMTLTGKKVLELFRQIAGVGGEGVSHGVELVIDGKGNLLSARLNGEEIDEGRSYRVATLDYLAQGNDKMLAFKDGTEINAPASADNNVRFIIMKYMGGLMKRGMAADSKIEGRITVKKQ